MTAPVEKTFTTREVAQVLQCSDRKVRDIAGRLSIGVDLGGRAGYRYSEDDLKRIWESLRAANPAVPA